MLPVPPGEGFPAVQNRGERYIDISKQLSSCRKATSTIQYRLFPIPQCMGSVAMRCTIPTLYVDGPCTECH